MSAEYSYPEKKYVIDNNKGRDLFIIQFYLLELRPAEKFPHFFSNIPILDLDSPTIKTLIEKLLNVSITEEEMDGCVDVLAKEIKTIPGIEKYYFGEEILIDEKYSTHRAEIFNNLEIDEFEKQTLKFEAQPLTNKVNSFYFFYLKHKMKQFPEVLKNYIEIDKLFFEKNLINDALRNEYLENYSDKNYFYLYISSEADASISFSFLLINDAETKMVFFLKNKIDVPSRVCDKLFYSEIRELRPVFNRYDPVDIFFGDNTGEYDPEIGNILIQLFYSDSDERVREVTTEVLIHWFSDTLSLANDITMKKISDLAGEIYEWLSRKRKSDERWLTI